MAWRNAREDFSLFLALTPEIRKGIYTRDVNQVTTAIVDWDEPRAGHGRRQFGGQADLISQKTAATAPA